MNNSLYHIPIPQLTICLLPVLAVGIFFWRWSLGVGTLVQACARMILQLVTIGFVLIYIFNQRSPWLMSVILFSMLMAAAWIATQPIRKHRLFQDALVSMSAGNIPTLALVVFAVLRLSPWYEARYLIPVAGMIFANSMNSVSLAGERYFAEIEKSGHYEAARNAAFKASLLPMINSFFAVGLVSLPGMMTGQILSGTSPLIAIRYQIMVMCMLLGGSGISSAIFLSLLRKRLNP